MRQSTYGNLFITLQTEQKMKIKLIILLNINYEEIINLSIDARDGVPTYDGTENGQ